MKTLSVIVPCFNEALNLNRFYTSLLEQINIINNINQQINYEIIFINDGSTDNTLSILNELKKNDSNIIVLDFSRNFGKEAGILAGLKECKGELITLLDADLQDPISLLPEMYNKIIVNKFDVVCVKRKNRSGDSKIRAFLSNAFYSLSGNLLNFKLQNGIRDFRLMTRDVVNAILQLNEYHRFSKKIFEWVGFKRDILEYDYIDRNDGYSTWSLYKLFKYALDGIFSFSATPLRVSFVLGLVSSLFALIYGSYVLISTLIFGNVVKGYPSIVCLISLFTGIQLIVMGIIGEYIARIYEQVKNRPNYILRENKND